MAAKIHNLAPTPELMLQGKYASDNKEKHSATTDNGEPPMDSWLEWRKKVDSRLYGVEKRLDIVENRLGNVEKEVKALSSKVESQYKGFRALVITLIIAVIGVWYLIDQRQESWIQHSVSQIQSANQSFIENNKAADRALLEQLDRRNSEQFQTLQRQLDRLDRSLE